MNGFFSWFKQKTKIKRWILLILIGIVLVCYGMAKVLVTNELEFKNLAIIIGTFVIGFLFAIVGIIQIHRRTLEILVEDTDTRTDEQKVNSLIFNKKVYNQGPKVVVIGGGSGLNTVLRGLKNYTDNITAIVTVSDYGAKNDMGVKEYEDIEGSLIALANNEEEMKKLLNAEMSKTADEKICFGDVYLSTMKKNEGDLSKAVLKSSDILNITGKVLPATLDRVKICVELDDGTVIDSKEKIKSEISNKISKISRVYISPTNTRVAPGVIEAIKEADSIIIGPGSLYTNVIPNLLIPGVAKAIRETKCFKIYVGNIMTEYGQTDNYTLYDHIKAIIDHVGKGIFDYCIYDTGEIVPEYIRKYNKEGSELIEQDVGKVKDEGIKLMQRNLSTIENGRIRHNSDVVATSIMELICEDLKFKDMQNDTRYIMLENKLKDTKKKIKKNKPQKIKKTKNKKSSSKFFEKYNDRIESIQSSGKPKKQKEIKKKSPENKENVNNNSTNNGEFEIKNVNFKLNSKEKK